MTHRRLEEWRSCERCGLHLHRKNVVLGEGEMPCDLLFVGEAPGKTENMMGRPFIGPAGRLLRQAMVFAGDIADLQELPTTFVTNLCGCRPTDSKFGPNRPPTDAEVWACRKRLELIVELCRPQAIVLLGNLAQSMAGDVCRGATKLPHPAWIMRMGGVESPQYRAFCADLSKVMSAFGTKRTAVALQKPKRKVIRKRGK